jgi:Transposase DDE domain group 1
MVDPAPLLPGLSPVCGKPLQARFDGGLVSSDGGLLLFREVEARLGLAARLAAGMNDGRDPDRVTHTAADIIRFRMLGIVAGYEDGNDCNALRTDPVFKLAAGRLPESGERLCSQSTVSRLENMPSRTTLYRLGRALVDQYCASYPKVPGRIVLDLDDTFDAAHGQQQMSLFNAHYDEHGFQPIVIFDDTGRLVTAVLRPAKRPSGREILTLIKRVVGRIRANMPNVRITLRGDGHYACPEVMVWCEAEGHKFIFGLPGTSTYHKHVTELSATTLARFQEMKAADPKLPSDTKVRRYKEFYDGAKSWTRTRRCVARVEAGDQGVDVRYIVTNIEGSNPKRLYADIYCARGQMENHIKSYKRHLSADRTSCSEATANQFRLFLHAGAYWLVWAFQQTVPKRSRWRTAQFDTIRLKLIKLGARVEELKKAVRVHLPTACPFEPIMRCIGGRLHLVRMLA